MILKNTLGKLGLPPFDAELYLALLKKGISPVGKLIEETGAHRDLVYGGLKRLEQEGLAQSIEKKKIKHYQALDPKALVRKMEMKAELARKALPKLNEIFKQTPVTIKIYEGSEGYEEIQQDIQASLKDNDEYYVIGGSGTDWFTVTGDFYMKYRKLCIKRGITLKSVTYAKDASGIEEKEPAGFCTVGILPEHFLTPSSTKIYADKVIIQIFGETPIAIMIQSKTVSESYKHFFQSLWNIANIPNKK